MFQRKSGAMLSPTQNASTFLFWASFLLSTRFVVVLLGKHPGKRYLDHVFLILKVMHVYHKKGGNFFKYKENNDRHLEIDHPMTAAVHILTRFLHVIVLYVFYI